MSRFLELESTALWKKLHPVLLDLSKVDGSILVLRSMVQPKLGQYRGLLKFLTQGGDKIVGIQTGYRTVVPAGRMIEDLLR